MFLLKRPQPTFVGHFIRAQAQLSFTYKAVGATAAEPPAGYTVDRTRIQLGVGQRVYLAGQAALRKWQHFQLGWVEPCWPDTPIESGRSVAILAQLFGLWNLNACRIVYVVDEDGAVVRSGFAYGTLPDHVESGEERFTVEWNRNDDSVWYNILAFSRPHSLAAWIGYPLARSLQRRFARDSARAVRRTVERIQ
jgi:uncharacterized protein (UPF0548 family)